MISFILGIVVGILLVPLVIWWRGARKGWDESNIFNVLRILCHLALHPEDFLKMRYPDGKDPFWYLTKDEFSEIVETRPNESNS